MIHLQINTRDITVPEGTTLLTAARSCGFDIPTMCYADGYEPFTSCMICVVQETLSQRLLPACSALALDGMVIETDNKEVHQARKNALDLLLSEHVGDCEEPCKRICPAHIDISEMMRQVRADDWQKAILTIMKHIPFPGVIGRICPAPCEKGCNRGHYDTPISIREMERMIADVNRNSRQPFQYAQQPATGFRVAIIGAGPAGLAAACYLQQFGHSCEVFDEHEKPGGALRSEISDEKLPKDILDEEISLILSTGVLLHSGTKIESHLLFKKICRDFQAVVLACGSVPVEICASTGIDFTPRGISVNPATMQTNIEHIFAGGNAVTPGHMAVKSIAHAKIIAFSINQFLTNKKVTDWHKPFQSIMGRPSDQQVMEFLKGIDEPFRQKSVKPGELNSTDMAIEEAGRCFHCDCAKPYTCKLRTFSEEYSASQQKYKSRGKQFIRDYQHLKIVFETGKCIKCGLCIQIAQKNSERLGLTFIGRGFDVRVAVPFHESLENGLEKVADQVVEYCPTGALSFKKGKM
jgi:hypothetical protein